MGYQHLEKMYSFHLNNISENISCDVKYNIDNLYLNGFIWCVLTEYAERQILCAIYCLMLFYVKIRLMQYTHVDTAVFTLLHSYMLQLARGHPQGVLIHFVSRVNEIRVQI